MFKRPLIPVLLFLLVGCTTTTQYGNYVENNSETHNSIIASDAAYQLMQIYPPASTKFNMQHVAEDSFGMAFVRSLRTGGYAIQENNRSNLAQVNRNNTVQENRMSNPVQPDNTVDNTGTTLAYIFDQTSDVYRLSVMVDEQILTRAYMPFEDKIEPAGSWVLKE